MNNPLVTFNAEVLMIRYQGKCKPRDGREAVVHTVYQDQTTAPLQGAIKDITGVMIPHYWRLGGENLPDGAGRSSNDLVMPETPLDTVYIPYSNKRIGRGAYNTKEAALKSHEPGERYGGTVKLVLKSNGTVEAKVNQGPDDGS